MKIVTKITLMSLFIGFFSCEPKPQKIEYGVDVCHFCKMTIVDKTHAAEMVTKKGRAHKYDAIECMIRENLENDKNDIALFLVTNYTQPESLIPAETAHFLVSKEIKSPMGAYLSAFKNKEDAQKYQGELFTWETIQQQFNK